MTKTYGTDPALAVVTVADDLHAHVIRETLRTRHGLDLTIIESDRIAKSGALSWTPEGVALVPDLDGKLIDVGALDLVWWRRPSGKSWDRNDTHLHDIRDEAALDVVKNDCKAAFQGLMKTSFTGHWLSSPEATQLAEHKLVQLNAAKRAGMRVPATLVSQDPERIRDFCARQQTVVKTVAGTSKTATVARMVDEYLMSRAASMRLSPAIWQHCVPGHRHLRIHAFGDDFVAAHMTCDELDWRVHLDQLEIDRWELSETLKGQLRSFMRTLGLTMGIFDMKIDDEGAIWFLEVNPQGQFLFVEGMSDIPLADIFADHLVAQGFAQTKAKHAA